MKKDIIIFESDNSDTVLPVSIDGETVWLSSNQMAILF